MNREEDQETVKEAIERGSRMVITGSKAKCSQS